MSAMASPEGSATSRLFAARPSGRVHCAACGLLFVAHRPSPDERLECPHCGEFVRIGRGVLRKLRVHSSRNSLAPWMGDPRSSLAESVGRAAIWVAFAAGVVFLLGSLCDRAASPDRAARPRGVDDVRFEDAIFNDSAGW